MSKGKTIDFKAFGEGQVQRDLLNVRISETLEEFSRSMVVKGSRVPKTTAKYDQIMRRFIGFAGDQGIHELQVEDFGKFKYKSRQEKEEVAKITFLTVANLLSALAITAPETKNRAASGCSTGGI